MASISGVSFSEVQAGAEEIEVSGLGFLVIGLRELRMNKRASGRIKDRDDLCRLRAVRRD